MPDVIPTISRARLRREVNQALDHARRRNPWVISTDEDAIRRTVDVLGWVQRGSFRTSAATLRALHAWYRSGVACLCPAAAAGLVPNESTLLSNPDHATWVMDFAQQFDRLTSDYPSSTPIRIVD